VNVAHHKGDGLFNPAVSVRAELGAEAVNSEVAPASREVRGCDSLNLRGGHNSIIAGREERPTSAALLYPRALKGKIASCLEAMGDPL
jgi:hypothetical protein